MSNQPRYQPGVFEVGNERQARNVILTPEGGESTDERWNRETPFLTKDLVDFLQPEKEQLILDYGCGIGRLARELLNASDCRILGVDISTSMRQLAPGYVGSQGFSVVSLPMFMQLVENGLRVNSAYVLWVLQHCPNVEFVVQLLNGVQPGGRLYVLNNNKSAIPTDQGWMSDGVDVKPVLEQAFEVESYSRLPESHVSSGIAEHTFIGKYLRR